MQVKARGVIVNPLGQIFLCKLKKGDFFCLPGGTMEEGELLDECLKREIHEELGVDTQIGDVLYINNFLRKSNGESVVDIRYSIPYSEVFDTIDLDVASHGFENSEVGFYDIDSVQGNVQPENLKEIIFGL